MRSGRKHMTVAEVLQPDKDKETDLASLFKGMMSEYEVKKREQLAEAVKRNKLRKEQNIKLRMYLFEMAKQFIQQRRRKDSGEALSLNKFIGALYRDCLEKYSEATHRNFPYDRKVTGEAIAKKMRRRPYPVKLKRRFFEIGIFSFIYIPTLIFDMIYTQLYLLINNDSTKCACI
jgi:hypothetical protein